MPQAIAAAAAWVGNAVGTAIGATLTAAGVTAATALPVAVTLASAAYYVAEVAIYAGLQSLVDDIATQKPAPMGQELNLRVASDVAREMIIGERPVAGSMVARYSYGSNLYNASFVYQLADHPCVELSKVYGDGRLVQATPLAHGVRTVITAYSYSGGPRVWMTWHDGRPGQTADSWLVSRSALDPEVVSGAIDGWTSDHRGAGCAYVHVEVQWDSDILTSIPQFLFHVRGAPLYDRRKDTTAGGSGFHRLNNPATWEYSTNAAVACDHYLLGYQVEGDPVAFGVGLSPSDVPYATFAQSANLADEDVTTGTGGDVEVIKRYACNAIISTAESFEYVLGNMQSQMCARIVDLGGRIGIIGAEEKIVSVSLSDLDWATNESVRFADKLSSAHLFGAVAGSFADPANMYNPTPYTRQETDYLALPNGGEATTAQLDLPYETHPRRAVRLASAWIARESLQPRLAGTFATRALAWKLEPGDWFNFSSDRLQVSLSKFEVVDIVKHSDFTVTLTARAIDENFLAFSVDEDPDLSIPPDIPPATLLLSTPTFDVEASTLVSGDIIEPCIQVTLTSDEEVAREIVIEYALDDPGPGDSDGDGSVDVLGPTLVDSFHISQVVTNIRKGILPTSNYRVRMKTKAGARESLWTAWSGIVTTPAASAVDWTNITGANKPADGATRNRVTHSSTAPTSPVNGDIWVDTSSTPYVEKHRVGGAWITAATNGAVFGGNLYETGGGALALLNAFKTVLGISSGFTGQGNLATLNSVAYGSAYATGFGGMAALSFATIGSNVRLADGTTVATNAMVVTSLGIASGISGQGALATQNSLAYGSAYLTGFAALAALNYVRLGGPTGDRAGLLNEASSQWMTDYLLITTAGIAAGFSGQGALAVLNAIATGNVNGNAISEFVGSQAGSYAVINNGSFWDSCHHAYIQKKADGGMRVVVQGEAYVASGSNYALGVRVYRNGVQVGRQFNWYFPALFANTFMCTVTIPSGPASTDTWDIMVNMNRSGAGVANGYINISDFTFEEFKR